MPRFRGGIYVLGFFVPINKWGGESELLNIQMRDSLKTDYCKNNKIKLIRISYMENINEVLNTKLNF